MEKEGTAGELIVTIEVDGGDPELEGVTGRTRAGLGTVHDFEFGDRAAVVPDDLPHVVDDHVVVPEVVRPRRLELAQHFGDAQPIGSASSPRWNRCKKTSKLKAHSLPQEHCGAAQEPVKRGLTTYDRLTSEGMFGGWCLSRSSKPSVGRC